MPRTPGYVTLNVTPEARDAVRALSFALTGSAGRRISLSEAVLVACGVAEQHADDARARAIALTDVPPTTPTTDPSRGDQR
jgi:hypothetical protein